MQIATVDSETLSIEIATQETTVTPQIISKGLVTGAQAFNNLRTVGHGFLDVYGTIKVRIGSFPATLNYVQKRVPSICS